MKPRKPLWTKGLFLAQHHLQAQDRYHERLLATRLESVLPYAWGVVELEIDEAALRAGQLRVSRLDAILPDGTPLMVGDGQVDDVLPSRPIDAFTGKNLTVYVALSREDGSTAAVDFSGDPAAMSRFIAAEARELDSATAKEERPVGWVRHNARLAFGAEPLDRFDALPVAELVRSASGAVALRDTFIPPVLRVGASRYLADGFRRVLATMIAKQQSLAQSRRLRSASVVDFQAQDAAKFWLLHTLNQTIPMIAEIVDKPETPPREAHSALAQLLGMLGTFDAEADPTSIPKYNHLGLGDVFDVMFNRVLKLLDTVIAERYVTVPLKVHERGLYTGEFRDPASLPYDYFLAVSGTGNISEPQIREHVPRLAKIASTARIESLMHSAVSGARIAHEYRVPAALPVKPGVLFFRIEKASDYWREILTTGGVAIYLPIDPSTVQLSLYGTEAQTLQ
ncbi:type VI secretion system baseplate subunit TssK [Pendulispora brunnea]|uniref:Type VI secretion system baseplate subunit TssK n=1 Tax=Pendulispora brunnea TaxID=2905690 RepID=A0ABZ2K055_9BACT